MQIKTVKNPSGEIWKYFVFTCDHPLYNACTLIDQNGVGLAVIQQRFNKKYKSTIWGAIDDMIAQDAIMNPKFPKYFEAKADTVDDNGLYPTITVRQLMWALRMPPLKRQIWETRFYT